MRTKSETCRYIFHNESAANFTSLKRASCIFKGADPDFVKVKALKYHWVRHGGENHA